MSIRSRSSSDARRSLVRRASTASKLLNAAVLAALAIPAAGQQQFVELAKRGLPTEDTRTGCVALGDVDGDGDLDLVCGTYQQQTRLYLNNGTGTFTDATSTHLPALNDVAAELAFGDIDGDGDLDLVCGNFGRSVNGQQNRLYLNNGTGTFTDATARLPVLIDRTSSVALGDVDGDGDLDIVFGNQTMVGRPQTRLCLNDGTGTFTDAPTRLPLNSDRISSVALGDVDGDGDLDLVCGNLGYGGGQTRLYLNDGTGTFTDATAARVPIDNDLTTCLALGDVDGDGDLDLVLANSAYNTTAQERLYLNDGTGTFADATSALLPFAYDRSSSVAFGDLDGDGDLDLVFGNAQQDRLYLNDGTGTFSEATAARLPVFDTSSDVRLGDVDGDGDLDLVCGQWDFEGAQNRLMLNNGDATFVDATATRMPINHDRTSVVALGDVDRDGDLDIVLGDWLYGQDRLYLNNGHGSFTDATASRMPRILSRTGCVALGDVNGDNDLDIVFGGAFNRLYLNNRFGTFLDASQRLPPGGNTSAMALGDVDGDGDLDLVCARSGRQNRLYLNDGTGTFVTAPAANWPVTFTNLHSVALGDVDGDGDLDVVFGAYLQNRLYLNNGSGSFADATATRMPIDFDTSEQVALGDLDGDGDLDIVFGNMGQRNRLYLNNGAGTFTDATAGRMPVVVAQTNSVALGDIDGDGDLDIVFGNNLLPRFQLLLNNGSGTFTDAAARMPTIPPFPTVALGDVDGDGDLDLVSGWDGRPTRLFLNLLRQLDAPYLLRVGLDYQLDVYARFGPARLFDVALPYFSLRAAHILMPPLGTIAIDPNSAVALPPLLIPQPDGVASLTVTVPNVPAITGIQVFTQAVLVQYPTQDRLTNANLDVIVR